jgi:hypothetical protein
MKLEKQQLDELKSKNIGGLYEGSINFYDESDTAYTVEFIYRKPTVGDIEAHAKASQRSPVMANLNLIQSVVAHPEPLEIIKQIRDYPAAAGRFVDEAIIPFFGGNVTIKRQKI